MLRGTKFLTGCGIGALASLVGVALFSAKGRRTVTEHLGKTDGRLVSNDSKPPPQGEPVASVAQAGFSPEANLLPFRRLKAAGWITAIGAITAAVAVIYFGLDFQKRIQKLSAQLTQSSETRSLVLQEEMRNDQRAWVGLMEATVQPLTAKGGGFTIKLQNTGKTPALDLQIADVITIEDIDQSAQPQEPNQVAGHSAGNLMPGAVYATDVWFETSPEAVSSLTHDQSRTVNFIRITYRDVFQTLHTTKVCFYWRSSLPNVKPCEGFNAMN